MPLVSRNTLFGAAEVLGPSMSRWLLGGAVPAGKVTESVLGRGAGDPGTGVEGLFGFGVGVVILVLRNLSGATVEAMTRGIEVVSRKTSELGRDVGF